MAETTGIVRKINKDTITVGITEGGKCASCAFAALCGIGNIKETEAIPRGQLKVGDKVKIIHKELSLILFAFMLFIMPLIVFITAYLILKSIVNSKLDAILSISILIGYFFLLGAIEKKYKKRLILPVAIKDTSHFLNIQNQDKG